MRKLPTIEELKVLPFSQEANIRGLRVIKLPASRFRVERAFAAPAEDARDLWRRIANSRLKGGWGNWQAVVGDFDCATKD